MKNKKLLCSVCFLFAFMSALWGQNITVKGNVTSKTDGQPIIGASVVETTATTNGTITDFDGNFTLSVPVNSTLKITYIGYKPVTVKAAAIVNVLLEEDTQMVDEVVVTGYTTQRKADLTGAVSVVKVDEIQKQGENNPVKALQGRVPGMNITADGNPSGSATVRIRGIGTLNNNDPLYIIDGVPTKAGMHELNGNDIESIQVLKDAASASIYGSRAANGVIIITTKQGKKGQIKINFDASVSASMYQSKMNVLNTEQYGRAMWQAYVNDGENPNGNALGYAYNWGYNADGNPVLYGMTLSKYLDSKNTMPVADTDWFDEITRTGVIQQYNLSVSNGSEKGSSFFSLGYYKNLGVIKDTDFDRFSARMNSDYKLIDDILTIGQHFTLNRTSEVQAPGGIIETALDIPSAIPVYASDGSWGGPVGGWPDRRNPRAVLEYNKDNRYTYWRMFGDAYVNLTPFKGFNLRSTFGLDYANKQARYFTYPYQEGTQTNNGKSAVEAKQEHWTKWMWNAIATYQLEVGKHRGDVMIGMELNREDDSHFSGYKEDFSILTPDYMWPDAGSGTAQAYGAGEGYSLVSFFGKMNYSYADRYLLSLTLRRDGSSRFGKNHRYATFPSVSLGWRITQENFMKELTWLDDLKLRASWGQLGNQNGLGLYDHIASYNINGYYPFKSELGQWAVISKLPSESRTWETVEVKNIAVDMAFLRNRLTVTGEYFIKKNKDMLVSIEIPSIIGIDVPTGNYGELKVKGWEVTVGWQDKIKDFSYGARFNLSDQKDKLVDYGVEYNGFVAGVNQKVQGYSLGSIFGYRTDGYFTSEEEVKNSAAFNKAITGVGDIKYIDKDGDGKISAPNDLEYLGTTTPRYTFGLNLTAAWKGFDLGVLLQGVGKRNFYLSSEVMNPYYATWNNFSYKMHNDYWTPENPNAAFPRYYAGANHNYQISDHWLQNAAYVRLKNLQFGYTISPKLTKSWGIKRLRVYFSGDNLCEYSKLNDNFDPELSNINGYVYPIMRNFSFGINVTL